MSDSESSYSIDSIDDSQPISAPGYTILFLNTQNMLYQQVLYTELIDDPLGMVHVYALFSFLLFFLSLYPYIFFIHQSSNREITQFSFVMIALSSFFPAMVINGMRFDISRYNWLRAMIGRTNVYRPITLFCIALQLLSIILFVVSFIYQNGFTHLYAFPLWLTLVPICYIGYYLAHHITVFLARLFALSFPSVSENLPLSLSCTAIIFVQSQLT